MKTGWGATSWSARTVADATRPPPSPFHLQASAGLLLSASSSLSPSLLRGSGELGLDGGTSTCDKGGRKDPCRLPNTGARRTICGDGGPAWELVSEREGAPDGHRSRRVTPGDKPPSARPARRPRPREMRSGRDEWRRRDDTRSPRRGSHPVATRCEDGRPGSR